MMSRGKVFLSRDEETPSAGMAAWFKIEKVGGIPFGRALRMNDSLASSLSSVVAIIVFDSPKHEELGLENVLRGDVLKMRRKM